MKRQSPPCLAQAGQAVVTGAVGGALAPFGQDTLEQYRAPVGQWVFWRAAAAAGAPPLGSALFSGAR